eukprot:COSAG02_NODE_2726_length_8154_cov_16.209808_2_plen_45_part_00
MPRFGKYISTIRIPGMRIVRGRVATTPPGRARRDALAGGWTTYY